MTLDQLLRFGYSTNRVHNENMGVGGYDCRSARATNRQPQSTTVPAYSRSGRWAGARS